MILPKKIMINHRNWNIKKDKEISNANFNYSKMNIIIGTCGNSDRETLANLVHEVGEISCVERGVRATKSMVSNESKDYVFVCDHGRFADVMNDISRAIGDVMKME